MAARNAKPITRYNKQGTLGILNPYVDARFHNTGYLTGKSDLKGNVILHGRNDSDIKILDASSGEIKQEISSDVDIGCLVTISNDCHVATDRLSRKLHILDVNFQRISVIETGRRIISLAYHSPKQFVMFETDASKTKYLSIVSVEGKDMTIEHQVELNWDKHIRDMDIEPDREHVIMCDDFHIYRVNLNDTTTYTITEVDVSKKVQNWEPLRQIHVAADGNIFVGDFKGKVHLFNKGLKYEATLATGVGGIVCGISMRGDKLVVSMEHNKIAVYNRFVETAV